MAKTDSNTIIDASQDPALSGMNSSSTTRLGPLPDNTYVDKNVEIINEPGGNINEVQFNVGGKFSGGRGLTFNSATDQLNVRGNINSGGYIKGKIVTNAYNFFIQGGNSGQVLSTDGTGNLTWVDQTGGSGNSTITVSEISGSTISNQVSSVSSIRFDKDTGFSVANLGNGSVKVSLGSSWKTWNVTGQSPLIAQGEDTVQFVAGTNTTITTNVTAKSITFNSTYGNPNVANYLPTHTGNLAGGNLVISNGVYAYNLSSTGTAFLTTLQVNAQSQLGSISNVKITGGTGGQVISTDGAGNLSWVSPQAGPQGATGAAGAAATISVGTVTTGAAGTNVIITNAGNSSVATFNFTIPKGDHGDQGPQGDPGAAGATGATGAQGAPGATGPKGDKGDTGEQGVAGNDGAAGATGATGAAGATGATGPKGDKGDQGVAGSTGAQGDTGPKGDKGDTGDQGVSVTLMGSVPTSGDLPTPGGTGEGYIVSNTGNLWFWNSTTTSWNDIGQIVGPQGDQGPTGATGATGAQGDQGVAGNDGATGATGATGPQGATGDPGPKGDTGDQGVAGNDGLDGTSFIWQGEWNASTAYVANDVVHYLGSTYICTTNNTDTLPTDTGFWELMSSKGDQGLQGDQGEVGPRGYGVSPGGTTGQVLVKSSDTDYDTVWQDSTETTININDIAPSSAIDGTVWWSSQAGRSYIKYNDQWVDMSPQTLSNPDVQANSVTFEDGTVQTTAYTGNGNISVDRLTNGIYGVVLENDGTLTVPGLVHLNFDNREVGFIDTNQHGVALSGAFGSSIAINTDGPVGQKNWQFSPEGNIRFPDGTEQNTAYTGQTTDSTILVSDSVPSSAPEGTLWFNSDEGRTYVKYSNTWVDTSPQTTQPPGNQLVNGDYVAELDTDGLINLPKGGQLGDAQRIHKGNPGGQHGVDLYASVNERYTQLNYNEDQYVWADEVAVGIDVGYNTPSMDDGITWRFKKTGNILFPDDTEQSTAYQGPATLLDGGSANANYASNISPAGIPNPFDQYLNTSDSVTFLNVTANNFTGNLVGNVSVANISGLGNIATINLTGSTANVLYGNGVFAPVTATMSNTTTDNFFINGEDRGLIVDAAGLKRFGFMKYSSIEGSLVHSAHSGTAVPLRIGRTTTADVTAATVNDFTTEIYVGTNGHVRIADDTVNDINDPTERLEVVGNIKANNIGNISALNLDGNSANVLYGNGVFAAVTGGSANTGNIGFTGTDMYSYTGLTIENADLSHSATSALIIPNNGSTSAVQLNNFYGDVTVTASNSGAGGLKSWRFGGDGNITMPGGTATIGTNGEFRLWATDMDITVYRNGQDGYGVKSGAVEVFANNTKITQTTSSGFEVLVGNITAGTIIANIAAANVVGIVGNATHANYADVANSVAAANVTGLGNIASLNLDSNASNVLYGNGTFSALPAMYSNTNVASYLSTNTANVANLIVSGAAPSTLLGSTGDTAGMIRADSNYFYYCTSTFVPSTWTVGWEGSIGDTLFITKGDYPTPQVGWIIDFGGFGPWTIDTVTDNGTSWQITWVGTSFGSPGGGTATLTNPNPATIWKQTPLAATVYSNTNATSLLASFGSNTISTTGNVTGGNLTTTGTLNATTAVLGNSATVTSSNYSIGYRDMPQIAASNTTLAATDGGKHYYSATAANFTLTIPNNTTTSFSTGTAISIVVQSAGNILVNAASGVTLYMAGNSTAANRYVNAYGMATLLKVGTDTWFINGTGVN